MTPATAYMLLLTTAALAAALVARRRPEHRPVAVYLGVVLALDLLRLGLARLLPAGQGPYEGWAEAVRGLDQGAYVGLVVALPLMGVGVFLRRRGGDDGRRLRIMTRLRLAIAAPYAALWLAVVWWYPTLRGDALLWLYGAAELAGGVFVAGCLVVWALRRKNRGRESRIQQEARADGGRPLGCPRGLRAAEHRRAGAAGSDDPAAAARPGLGGADQAPPSQAPGAATGAAHGHGQGLELTTACVIALTSASLATTLLPALRGPAMIAGWPAVVTVWCVALGIVLGVQGWELLR